MTRVFAVAFCMGCAMFAESANGQATTRRWAHEFTSVASACERSDGSVIATDNRDASIVLLGNDGSSRALSRRGNGPGEFQSPGECFTMAGDSVLIHDRAVGRYLIVAPGSNTVTTLSRPASIAGGWYDLRGVDDRGRFLLERRVDDTRAALIRWDRGQGAIDTLGLIPTGEAKTITAGPITASRVPPFSPRAAAVAGPVLGVAIVHATPFSVETHRNGASKKGANIPFTPIAVDERDIERVVEKLAPPAGTTGMSSTGQQVTIPQRHWRLENFGLTRAAIPSHKPAFDHEGVFASLAGAVWIRVHQASSAQAERYEVWTPTGQRGAPVTLAAGRRLAGLGARAAYVVATDADGIQTIERVNVPG